MNKLNNNEALQMNTVMPTMKKSLLALAVAGTMAMSNAFAADFTLTEADEWDDAGEGVIAAVAAGDNVDIVTFDMSITGTGDATAFGAITGTTGDLLITAATTADAAATGASITLTGAASNITITNADGASGGNADLATTGAVSIVGNFSQVNLMTTATAAMASSIGGALTVGGTTTITGADDVADGAGSSSSLTVTGNSTFTGLVTLTGDDQLGHANLNLNGATVTATAGIILDDAGTGLATVNFTGTAAQTVNGTINATSTTDEGTVNVLASANVVTFANNIGATATNILAVNIGNATLAGNAVFSGNVEAATITLGHATSAASAAYSADFNGNVVGDVVMDTGNAITETATATFAGNVTGDITLDDNVAAIDATATFDGTTAQTVLGTVAATTDTDGALRVTNTAGVTFQGVVGSSSTGIGSLGIASDSSMIQKALAGTTVTFDITGNVDDGAGATGGTLSIEAGDAISGTAGNVVTLATITGVTKLTSINFEGGAAIENDLGGAVTSVIMTGATTATTYSLLGGAGGSDGVNTGGVGGDIDTFLQTGATTADNLNMTGGAGGVGVAEDASGIGGKGGEVGDTSNTFVGLVTATVNMTGGAGGIGGVGDDETGSADTIGGKGGAGGAVTVTDFTGGITGNLVLTSGAGSNGGLGILQAGGIGGAGGAVTLTDISAGAVAGNVSVIGGTAGTGGVSGVAAGATGGAGGAITVSDITAAITGDLVVTGAAGGTGGVGTGAAGAGTGGIGGTITTTITGDLTGNATITAGAGGSGGAAGAGAGAGGTGGVGSSVTANFAGGISGILTLDDGAAGSAGAAGTGTVGAAAAAGTVTVNLTGSTAETIGSVVAETDGEGTLVVNNSSGSLITTFSGAVGSSTAAIGALTLTNGLTKFSGDVYADTITGSTTAGDIANFDGNVTSENAIAINDGTATFAKNVTAAMILDDGEDITFDGTTAQTITGAITSVEDKKGNITVSNTGGTVTFSNAIGVASTDLAVETITLAASTTTVFDAAVAANALSASGAMTLNAAVVLDGTLTTGIGSTITLGSAFKAGSAAAITAGATSVGTLAQTVNTVTVNTSNQFTTGTVTLFKNSHALDADDVASFNVTDTAIVDYTAALSTSTLAVEITANKRTTAGIATYLGMSTAQSAALGQISAAVASGDATASTALDTVLAAGGSTAVNAAEQLNSDAGAAMGAAMAVTGGVNNVIAGRQANTKIAFNTLGKQSGVSTGDAANDAVVWAQVFTSDATQDKVNNIDGYDADSQGLVVGWEAEKAGSTFGLSLSFADTDVDGKSAAAAHIDTSSVQGTIYGSNGSADWMMGYASADNDTTRTINFGGLTTRTATGNYASNILMAKAGYSFDSIEMAGGVATLTPKADLSWTHINNDGYTETGASNLNLIVDSTSNDVVTARAGMEFAQRIENNGSVTIPRVSIMGGYDLNNDRAETTSTFTGGGSSFTTQGIDPSNASLELGVGVDHVSDDSTVSFNFNTNLKDGYNSDTASLTYKSKF